VRAMLAMNSRANLLTATFICPLLAFAFAFAGDLVTFVYTADYLDAAPVMRLYIVGLLAGLVEMGSILLLLRQGRYALGVNTIALLLSVAVSLHAAGLFGLTGAAAGSVVALWFDRCVNLRRIARQTAIPLRRLQDWPALGGRIASAALAAAFAWLLVEHALPAAAPFGRLVLGGACVLAVYGALQLGTRSGREAMDALRNWKRA
jgi:O-antigen/teichoic acid export membrane protein